MLLYVRIYVFNCFFYYHTLAKIVYNTYREDMTRATPYSPQVIDKTCLLKPDAGPCRAEFTMYYYEPRDKNCSTFSWGGCQGNGNRFDSRKECLGSCLSSPNHPKTKPKWCSLNFDYGFCFGSLKRWFYDPMWKVCKERIYSGCGGNKNNFYNREQCDAICKFGNEALRTLTKSKSGHKKVLIIDPWNATSRKGRNQTILSTSPTTKKKLNN